MSIKLALTPEQAKQLQAAAKRRNVPPAALVSAAVRDLAQASTDFKRVADRIVDKNRELYRRLASLGP